ncbi:MAG: endo alpha-1,4 polygalactosaminidase [Maritimibacter sp.]
MTLLRLSLALLLILATPALAGPPPPGARFDIQLQAPMAFNAPLEAIELDPNEVSAAEVAKLNRRGVYTIGQASGFPLSRRDVVAYVSKLAQSAHAMGLGLGQKNFPEAITALSPLLDFAVVESCFAQGWCNAEAPDIARGKPVFAIEYGVPAAKQPGLCAEAARQKISLVFKTLDLTAEGTGCP